MSELLSICFVAVVILSSSLTEIISSKLSHTRTNGAGILCLVRDEIG